MVADYLIIKQLSAALKSSPYCLAGLFCRTLIAASKPLPRTLLLNHD